MLRCNRCDRPICTACAVLTPTGYRCKECVRGQQKVFDTAQWIDYPLAFVVAGVLSFLGSLAASYLGFFTIFIAPIVGRHHGRSGALGRSPPPLAAALQLASRRAHRWRTAYPADGPPTPLVLAAAACGLFSLFWPGVYLFLVTSTTYYRLSGIQIR